MRKRLINFPQRFEAANSDWLDLALLAQVEVTSEEAGFPIEAALMAESSLTGSGWRASSQGEQLIRLLLETSTDEG